MVHHHPAPYFVKTTDGQIIEPKMSASFVPDHKASMVLFLDRVYGIDNQDFLLHVLEVGFLPDMRAAASLDTVSWKTETFLSTPQMCTSSVYRNPYNILFFLSSRLSIGGIQYD